MPLTDDQQNEFKAVADALKVNIIDIYVHEASTNTMMPMNIYISDLLILNAELLIKYIDMVLCNWEISTLYQNLYQALDALIVFGSTFPRIGYHRVDLYCKCRLYARNQRN